MQFLIQTNSPNWRDEFKVRGIVSVLQACGHTVNEWDSTKKPVFDIFDESNPDIVILFNAIMGHQRIFLALEECLRERQGKVKMTFWDEIRPAADIINFSEGPFVKAYETDNLHIG